MWKKVSHTLLISDLGNLKEFMRGIQRDGRQDWKECLLDGNVEKEIKEIRRHECTGRPLGRDGFVMGLEKALGRMLRYQKSGPKGKKKK